MNKKILDILYLGNIVLVLFSISLTIFHFLGYEGLNDFLLSELGVNIRSILSIMVVVLWIYCIYVWSKFDKKPIRLILLIFLSAFYIVFYYKKIIKSGWIKPQASASL